jgi:hypothetical protein
LRAGQLPWRVSEPLPITENPPLEQLRKGAGVFFNRSLLQICGHHIQQLFGGAFPALLVRIFQQVSRTCCSVISEGELEGVDFPGNSKVVTALVFIYPKLGDIGKQRT